MIALLVIACCAVGYWYARMIGCAFEGRLLLVILCFRIGSGLGSFLAEVARALHH